MDYNPNSDLVRSACGERCWNIRCTTWVIHALPEKGRPMPRLANRRNECDMCGNLYTNKVMGTIEQCLELDCEIESNMEVSGDIGYICNKCGDEVYKVIGEWDNDLEIKEPEDYDME